VTIDQGETGSRGRTRLARLVGLLAALLLVPVIVGVGVSAASGPSGAYSVTVAIDIHYSHYSPDLLSVPAGVPVRFVIRNLDPIDHEWIVGDAAVHAIHRTGTEMHHGARPTEVSIAAGQTVETIVTFAATGQRQSICHLPGHEQYGMVGTLDIR
jgi:uncharacterized cupredoxin-like copper-binding protein